MNKLFVFFVLLAWVAVGIAWYYREDSMYARQVLRMYQGNNEILLGRLKKVYADKLETDKRNAELEASAAEDKTGFDWNYDISRSPVIVRLQKR